MQQLRRLIFFSVVSLSLSGFANEQSYKSVRQTVIKHQRSIKAQKTTKAKVAEFNKLKKYVNSIKTTSTGKKYDYLFRLKEVVNTIKVSKLSNKGCNITKDYVLFNYGYTPDTSYKKTGRGVKEGLTTLKLLCPKLRI